MLGSLELSQAYSTSNLTESQKTILEDLSALGLIYQSSKTSAKFYPTRLATTLTSDSPALRASTSGSTVSNSSGEVTDGFIVIETNYRLYAYTTSPLQIAILQLFTKLETRYPNMVSGRLTRSSVISWRSGGCRCTPYGAGRRPDMPRGHPPRFVYWPPPVGGRRPRDESRGDGQDTSGCCAAR